MGHRNEEISKTLIRLMRGLGWRVRKNYTAIEGSVYLQFEQPGEDGLISGKVRISDHEEQSSSHVAPEFELIADKTFDTSCLPEVAQAIHDHTPGQW